MAEQDPPMVPTDERTRVRAAESRVEFITAGLFTLLLFGTLAYVYTHTC